MQKPGLGRIVWYRSRTGNYTCPAIITSTEEFLKEAGVEAGRIAPLDSDEHVHLTVFTAGFPGHRVDAEDYEVSEAEQNGQVPRSENVSGTYQEWNVPPAPETVKAGKANEQEAGTWAWPPRSS